MPWEYKTVRAQREEFVLAAQRGGNFSALCREFGISRKTGYKWMQRAQNGEEFDDRSRKPKRVSEPVQDLFFCYNVASSAASVNHFFVRRDVSHESRISQ